MQYSWMCGVMGISPHLPITRVKPEVNAGQATSYLAPCPPCSDDPETEKEKIDKLNFWWFGRKERKKNNKTQTTKRYLF